MTSAKEIAAEHFRQSRARTRTLEYRWQRRQRRIPHRLAYIRLREIERVLVDHYGGELLPDDDAGRADLRIAFHHIAYMHGDLRKKMLGWAAHWAPWMPQAEVEENMRKRPKPYVANQLACELGVTLEARTRLSLRTIGANDCTKAERFRFAKQRARELRHARRMRQGMTPRSRSLTKRAPWKAAGMSRAKWYRLRKRGETDLVGAMSVANYGDHTCLTNIPVSQQPGETKNSSEPDAKRSPPKGRELSGAEGGSTTEKKKKKTARAKPEASGGAERAATVQHCTASQQRGRRRSLVLAAATLRKGQRK